MVNRLKIIFYSLSLVMLAVLLMISRDAGISGDEEVHLRQAENVYDYYASLGKDQDALNTPKTHLQYYGQSPDNVSYILSRWFGIKDIYGFRHLFSSFLGWLVIFTTALFARWLKGYGAAIFTLVLFAVSPGFLGHLQNNLKDIPFALAYIAGVYYILKLTYSKFNSQQSITISLLIASIAFSVSIRAGGILLVFYLLLAAFIYYFIEYHYNKKIDWVQIRRTALLLLIVSAAGYLLGLLLWPYALQNPVINPWKSYKVMASFPTTIQQIFEGKFIWSDFHPWYYLPKYMLITIPIVVFAGLLLFIVFIRRIVEGDHRITYAFLIFTVLFPMVFAIITNANLYGGWRHFIFIYPPVVILSAIGLNQVFVRYKKIMVRGIFIVLFICLSIHPLKFMAASHPYYYLYYNQLTGGLKGAYGKYETDYYYHTMRAGAEWLKEYLKESGKKGKIVIGSNFPVDWYFRDMENIQFQYFPYSRRSEADWDYAIIGNSYVSPDQLKEGNFPPEGTIHEVLIEGRPMCVVVARESKLPLMGTIAFENKEYMNAADYYREALGHYKKDEHIYYKLGKSLNLHGQNREALEAVTRSLAINEHYEPALRLSGQLKVANGDYEGALDDLEKLIGSNKKYFGAYVDLAEVFMKKGELEKARETLRTCLRINSMYKPAILSLGKTFEKSDPDIADKYYELANSIN